MSANASSKWNAARCRCLCEAATRDTRINMSPSGREHLDHLVRVVSVESIIAEDSAWQSARRRENAEAYFGPIALRTEIHSSDSDTPTGDVTVARII